jgi:hypothetical protein
MMAVFVAVLLYRRKGDLIMRIKELVEKYEKNNRIDVAKEIEAVSYIGILQKRQIAELVLDNCTSVVDGEVHIDSVERYLLFTMAVITAHTNLEFDHENNSAIDDYDELCKSGLLIKVIDTFSDDYASCQEILNMMTADKLQYSMTIEKKLYQFFDNVQYTLDEALGDIVEKINFDGINDLLADKSKLLKLTNLFEKK